MINTIDKLSRGLAQASSRRAAIQLIFGTAAAAVTAGCVGMFAPKKKQTGFEQCGALGLLYCGSVSVPQTLADGETGMCCASPFASIGYLCAYGSNRGAAGCFGTLQDARASCQSAPSIVRCTT